MTSALVSCPSPTRQHGKAGENRSAATNATPSGSNARIASREPTTATTTDAVAAAEEEEGAIAPDDAEFARVSRLVDALDQTRSKEEEDALQARLERKRRQVVERDHPDRAETIVKDLDSLNQAMAGVDDQLLATGAERIEDYLSRHRTNIIQAETERQQQKTEAERNAKQLADAKLKRAQETQAAQAAAAERKAAKLHARDEELITGSSSIRSVPGAAQPPKAKKKKIKDASEMVLEEDRSYVSQLHEYLQLTKCHSMPQWDSTSHYDGPVLSSEHLRHVVRCTIDGTLHSLEEGFRTVKLGKEALSKEILLNWYQVKRADAPRV